MHTPLCHHATGEPVDYRPAPRLAVGLEETRLLGPFRQCNRTILTTGGCGSINWTEYVDKVRKAQRLSALTIRLAWKWIICPDRKNGFAD